MNQFTARTALLVICLSFLLLACSGDKSIEVAQPNEGQSLQDYVASQALSGAVLVVKDGEVLLNRGYGYAQRNSETANASNTIFRIGSVTKQFTSVAVLILEQRGLLSLDDSLSMYIPDYPNGENITLRHLLNMTSGIVNFTSLNDFMTFKRIEHTPLELIERFKHLPTKFPPGTESDYSNSNYVLAGFIVEQVSDMSYAAFIEQEIFEPLGMSDSHYGQDTIGYDSFAQGYANDLPVAEISMSVPYAAGALVSSTRDLYKWHTGLTERLLLTDATTEKLYETGLNGYALGWNVSIENGEQLFQHGGNIDGFSSFILRSEDTDTLVVVLANEEEFPSGKLAQNIMKIIRDN